MLFRPLLYHSPDELVMLWTETPSQALRENRSAFWNSEEWRRQSRSFTDLTVFDGVAATMTHAGETQRVCAARISSNLFPLLGVQPRDGRSFSADEVGERRRLAVISHRFWQARFGGSLDALGASVDLDGHASRIIGILPDGFQFATLNAYVFEPHTLFPYWEARRVVRRRDSWFVIGRLRRDVTVEEAQTEMSTIARRLDAQLPVTERNRGVWVVRLSRHVVGAWSRLALWNVDGRGGVGAAGRRGQRREPLVGSEPRSRAGRGPAGRARCKLRPARAPAPDRKHDARGGRRCPRRYGMTGSLSYRRRARARDKVAEAAYDSRVDTERGVRAADERSRS